MLCGGGTTWAHREGQRAGHSASRRLREKPRTPELGLQPHPKEVQPGGMMAVGEMFDAGGDSSTAALMKHLLHLSPLGFYRHQSPETPSKGQNLEFTAPAATKTTVAIETAFIRYDKFTAPLPHKLLHVPQAINDIFTLFPQSY